MKTQTAILETRNDFAPTSLHHLVNRLSDSLAPAAQRNKSFIINNVPENICAWGNENHVSSVLSQLMNVIIMHTGNSCVRISAKMFGDVVLLHVKDDGSLNYDSISQTLAELQLLAERMGGFVGFTSYRNKLTTIAFSFTNSPRAIS